MNRRWGETTSIGHEFVWCISDGGDWLPRGPYREGWRRYREISTLRCGREQANSARRRLARSTTPRVSCERQRVTRRHLMWKAQVLVCPKGHSHRGEGLRHDHPPGGKRRPASEARLLPVGGQRRG